MKSDISKQARTWMLAVALLSVGSVLTGGAQAADEFTAAEFLQQSEFNRSSYIRVSLMMANMIAIENDQKQADCIGDWYFADQKGRDEIMYSVMKKHPSYHPMGIIVAVIEKQCGSFNYIAD